MNQITHWLDGSNIYGSEHEEAENLREKRDGLLKSTTKGRNEMLPQCDQRPPLILFNERDEKNEAMEACRTCPRQNACSGHSCCFIGGKTYDLLLITLTKVIIHKSRGEVSLVGQDTIDYVSTAYFEPKKNLFFYKRNIMQLFCADATMFCFLDKILPMKT